MRRLFFVIAVLGVLPLLGSDSPKEYSDAVTHSEIEGTWEAVEVKLEDGTKAIPFSTITTYKGGKYSAYYPALKQADPGIYFIDSTRRPAQIDEISLEGFRKGDKVNKYIYDVQGKTLRIAHTTRDDGRRPAGFDDKNIDVWIYKKVK